MISVFGASGFIGSHFCNTFPKEVHIQERDSMVPETNNILFLISTVHNYNVFTNPTIDIMTNGAMPMSVLWSAKEKFGSDFTFTYVSSWFVYGWNDQLSTENAVCRPEGLYSISKFAGEMLVKSFCETYGIKWRVLRLASILGVGDKKASLKKNAVQYLLEEMGRKHPITIYDTPSYRDIMDVRDCVQAIHLVMNSKGTENQIWNIGNGISYNVKRLLEFVGSALSAKIDYMKVPQFHSQVQSQFFKMDTTKLKSLGYKRVYSLKSTIGWILGY